MTEPTADLDQTLQDAIKLHQGGQLAEAERLYREILTAAPHHAETLSMLGVLAAQTGDLHRGREFVKAAVAERPEHAGYRFNLAHIHHMAGDPAAESIYREVLALDPAHVPALVNLGGLMLSSGRLDAAADCFETALRADPNLVAALEGLGLTRQRQHRSADAIAAFERVLALEPNDANTESNLGLLLLEVGRNDDAIVRISSAINRLPGHADLHCNLGVALLSAGRPQDARRALARALQLDPGYTRALGVEGLVRAELGEDASPIFNYDGLLASTQINAAPGYSDIGRFNEDIARQVLDHAAAMTDRPGKTTRMGSQTGNLTEDAKGALALLERMIRQAVNGYFSMAAGLPPGVFPLPIPPRWRINLWGTVLRSGGHQDPHNHPGGILSGVYYTRIPQRYDETGGENQGAIEFGAPPAALHISASLPQRMIQPVEGQLLMFPSYFWHRTVPAFGERERISVAFDVVPTT